MNRKDYEARYQLFQYFALNDQRTYYNRTAAKNRAAGTQVNRYRAMLAFLTGASAALVGVIVQIAFVNGGTCTADPNAGLCSVWSGVVLALTVASVTLPAVAAFFSTLADLYQWDRLISIYDSAKENLEVADALSPDSEMPTNVYRQAYANYVEGTLTVMNDESAQWGQSIRTPQALQEFVQAQRQRAAEVGGVSPESAEPSDTVTP